MLSYKTIIALQCISLLHRANSRGTTTSELKTRIGRQHSFGIRRTMLAMIQAGWVVYRDNGRYRLTVDLHDKTLYDLVMAVDHDLRLDTHVAIGPLWGSDAADAVPNAILVDDNLGRIMTIILQSIALVYLTETPKDNQ